MESVHTGGLIDAAPLAMTIVDRDLRLVQVNRPFAELLGRSPEDLVGRPAIETLDPADAPTIAMRMREVLAGQRDCVDVECRMVGPDGRPMPVCLLTRPWGDRHDGSEALLVTVVDRRPIQSLMDEARSSESRIRSAMLALADVREPAQVRDLILTMARSIMGAQYAAMLIVEEGGSTERFVHHGIDQDLVERMGPLPVGKGVLSLITADSGPVTLADLRTHPSSIGVPRGHPVMTSFLGVPVAKDGELLARLYFANKINRAEFDAADRELAIALAAHAASALTNARIHDRMTRLVEELDRVNAVLEEGAQRRLRFLATVTHELRTPIHAILIGAELVSDPALGALTEQRMRELGDKIHASGKHLLGLIDDVVDLARIDSGHQELSPEPTALQGLIHEAVAAAGPLARDRGVTLTSIDHDDVRADVDPLRLRQVLLNLITNALKFTAPGGASGSTGSPSLRGCGSPSTTLAWGSRPRASSGSSSRSSG